MSARDADSPDPESGRIMLLSLGFVVLGLMLVGVIASAGAVHLDHKRLDNLADLLAASAAGAPSGAALVADGGLLLTDADVASGLRDDLADYPFPTDLPADLRVAVADAPDGRSARVVLTATSHPPLVRWFTRRFGGGFALTATATARAVVAGP